MGGMAAGSAVSMPGSAAGLTMKTTSSGPPRKVIVGTAMQAFWVPYPGLQNRLDQLARIVDEMAGDATRKYGRGLDLAILPEVAITGELSGGDEALERAVPFEGLVQEVFARSAREHHCYIVVPTYLRESKENKLLSNAAILVGRKGEMVGMYRKVHLVVSTETGSTEAGAIYGHAQPVFQSDFGKLAMQICYDMEFDEGWQELALHGAELIAWPTQSPQTAQPAFRAMQQRCYIVSSTWRHNASVFEPTGRIAAQITPPARVLVHEIDLSYAILPWSRKLRKGEALRKTYGERVGFRYYEEEDRGIFWSNDPKVPIGEMVHSLGLTEIEQEREQVQKIYRGAGLPGC
jgi:predicted amidohydrolase